MRKTYFILTAILIIVLQTQNIYAFGKRDSDIIETQTIEQTGITKVIIDIDANFNIKVKGVEDPDLVGEIASENLRLYDIETKQTGEKLVINISSRDFPFIRRPENNDIFLNVPINTEIDLDTEGGIILIDSCNGEKIISSETGDICVINSSGDIFADNNTGDIIFGNIIGNIEADSDTGDILVYNTKGKLNLNTHTGKLEGDLIELTDDSLFNTNTGTINFELVNNLSEFSYDLSTELGTIMLDTIQSTGSYKSESGLINIHAETELGDIIFK